MANEQGQERQKGLYEDGEPGQREKVDGENRHASHQPQIRTHNVPPKAIVLPV